MTKTRSFTVLIVGMACGYFAAASAATPVFTTTDRAIEADVNSVVLPSGPNSSLVVTPCAGCKPQSMLATASTKYFLKRQQVTLGELRQALTGKTDVYVGVFQSVKTGELTRIVAALDGPALVPGRTSVKQK